MARFAGIVHGVVVQIRTEAPSRSPSRVRTIGNRTQIVVEVFSWYSTSASASAVLSTADHITGFEPR